MMWAISLSGLPSSQMVVRLWNFTPGTGWSLDGAIGFHRRIAEIAVHPYAQLYASWLLSHRYRIVV